ncbi:YheC/YheD family protein [Ammoniphilus sp. CFH 90114]|uniref:YheC/YheD family endospore coat-associated protein n=1 Tax=Ammoniphilus sp. CFH 90114 TaxID=2493665 RepID=UPI00100E1596|nr:YheC/YheD family protein [Ammoniphilus sp. CFH 90114]RXT04807.1 YheC/YheD family protein [Ammoniphilus sp. CFH 90114]
MENSALGIMTVHAPGKPPFPERVFFRRLIERGQKEGISVIVFHPTAIHFETQKLNGFTLDQKGKWQTITAPIPPFIYDRCFYLGTKYNRTYKPQIDRLLSLKGIRFLGVGLKGKWQMYQLVKNHPTLASYLPPTERVENLDQIQSWLQRYPSIILKPMSGSLGIGVMKASKSNSAIIVEGRGKNNVPFRKSFKSFQSFCTFFKSRIERWKYLIQPYLTLKTQHGVPFDVRLLVQKDGTGQWVTTGSAIRMGQSKSITSNLHGGGKAFSFHQFLEQYYTPVQAEKINSKIAIIERTLPKYLEKHHGPLVEIGIDIGIDSDQNVWLIEVNSKPGRQIFEQLQDKEAVLKSQLSPLYYAKYLMRSY